MAATPEIEYTVVYKIIIIGDSGVGKSSLLGRYVDGKFAENFTPTIGVDFKVQTAEIEGQVIKLQLWDTAGQERFRTMTRTYYRGAHGIIFVFDVTDPKSFDSLPDWLKEVEANAGKGDQCMLLVGNKSDQVARRVVEVARAKEFAKLYDMPYIETSAKHSINVEQAFLKMAHEIYSRKGGQPFASMPNDSKAKVVDPSGRSIAPTQERSAPAAKRSSCC